ncbi:MAG TPA: acyl-CoA dehydrogenase family protein [Acidimicrobiales bacterium]|jgi:alkylation response protein AidB-like acyl-CoA dehydrogenase
MDLELTDDQQLYLETTVRFIESELPVARTRALHDDPRGYDEKWLRKTAELGWFAMLVPEEHGGGSVSGHGILDAAIVAEALGRYVQPGPFIPMNVVAAAIAEHGTSEQQASILPGIVAGEVVVTWAPLDVDGQWDLGRGLVAEVDGDEVVLTGVRGFVQDAQSADHLLVTASCDGEPLQLLVPAGAAHITPLTCLDLTRRMAEVTFDHARVPSATRLASDVRDALERQEQVAVALCCAETIGALDTMFSMTVAYSKDRVAFGRPIGSFQSLKHVMADVSYYLECCKAAAVEAARAVDSRSSDAAEVTTMAASYIAEHATEIAQQSLQVHGGIGYTWEHDLHLYMRRTRTNSTLYGEPALHRERLCEVHGL